MRVVICGDTHIGAVFGLGGSNGKGGNTRVDDYERTLNYIIDHAIDTGADAFIQTGDAFESRTPSPEHMAVLDRAIKKLSMANITSIIIMGNHDYKSSGTTFTSDITFLNSKELPNVRIVLEPQNLTLMNKDGDGVNLALFPFRHKKMYPGTTIEETSLQYENHVKEVVSTRDPNFPVVAVGHNFFFEGSYSSFNGSEVLTRISAFEDCDLVAMGHLHQFRIVNKKKPVAIYTGSMERINFGDKDVDKYFIDYDTNSKKIKVIKTPIRDLCDETLDLSDLYDENLDLHESEIINNFKDDMYKKIKTIDVKDKIVRLKVSVKERVRASIKQSDIEKFLYAQGAFYVSKVIIETIFSRTVRDVSILKEKSDYAMFAAFVKGQTLDEDLKNIILEESKKIMEKHASS